MQLTVNQPDLSQMFGPDNLYSTLYGMQRMDQANANQQQNLGQAQQDTNFAAQRLPFELQQSAANIGHTQALTGLTNAQTPGMQAKSNMDVRNDQVDSMIPLDKKRDAALSKIAAGMTEDQAKAHEAQATSDLFATNQDGSPDIPTRKNAQMVLDNMPQVRAKMREIAQEGANAANVANINQAGANSRDAADIAAGRFNKNSMEYLKFQANAKANFQQQAGIAQKEYEDYVNSAQNAADPDEKAFYVNKAQEALKAKNEAILNDYRAKQAAGTAANVAKPDLNSLGVPTVVPQNALPAPPVAPGSSEPAKTGMARVQASDGSIHMVPRSALANMPKTMKVLD